MASGDLPVLGGSCASLCHEYIFNEQKDIQLALKTLKNEKEDPKVMEEKKEENHTKFGNTIHFKDHDEEIPPTPPLPWNIRRPKRSYSSEIIRGDHYTRHEQEERHREWESLDQEDYVPPGRYLGESSGYHSGPNSGHKTPSIQRRKLQGYNSHSLTRANPHKQSSKHRKISTGHKNDPHNSSKHYNSATRSQDTQHYVDY